VIERRRSAARHATVFNRERQSGREKHSRVFFAPAFFVGASMTAQDMAFVISAIVSGILAVIAALTGMFVTVTKIRAMTERSAKVESKVDKVVDAAKEIKEVTDKSHDIINSRFTALEGVVEDLRRLVISKDQVIATEKASAASLAVQYQKDIAAKDTLIAAQQLAVAPPADPPAQAPHKKGK
jgi:hypothetical protein